MFFQPRIIQECSFWYVFSFLRTCLNAVNSIKKLLHPDVYDKGMRPCENGLYVVHLAPYRLALFRRGASSALQRRVGLIHAAGGPIVGDRVFLAWISACLWSPLEIKRHLPLRVTAIPSSLRLSFAPEIIYTAKPPQTCCKFYAGFLQLVISHFWNDLQQACGLQICKPVDSKFWQWIATRLMITRFHNQRAISLLATCNRFVFNKLLPATQKHSSWPSLSARSQQTCAFWIFYLNL